MSAWIAGIVSLIAFGPGVLAQEVITPEDRLKWVAISTAGPASLAGGTVSAGFGTLINLPSDPYCVSICVIRFVYSCWSLLHLLTRFA